MAWQRFRTWVYGFSVRYPGLGPLVWVSSCLYFFAQIVVGWTWNPPYSVVRNSISDLGNTHCGMYGGLNVCSPRHELMNGAFVFLGVVMAVGSLLIHQEFVERPGRERAGAFVAFSLMAIGGLGAVVVGLFPENTGGAVHGIGAGVAIGAGNLAIFVLGVAVPLPDGLRVNMLIWSAVSLSAAVLFACHRDFGIGAGSMERIAAYPETIWLIRFGIYISQNHYSSKHEQNPATDATCR